MSILRVLSLIALLSTVVVARPPSISALVNTISSQSPIGLTHVSAKKTRVPILLGVMSRCPDALLCESVLDGAFKETFDIVNVSLSFIGKVNDSDTDYGVTCMHGVEECRGNVQELCAISRANSQEDWWHFVQCLNFEGKDKVGDEGLAQRCAGVASIPWDDESDNGTTTRKGINECVKSQEGKDLLKASVKQSEELGIHTSCTIMISGATRCIRDGTWKECETGHTVEELISYIKEEYQRLNDGES